MLFVFTMGACGNFGGCGACGAVSPLPGGKLPADQTVEGGAQIRVTPQGFTKLTSILPGALNQQLANGFCVAQGQVGNPGGFLGTGARYCDTTNGTCNPGCKVDVALNPGGFSLSVTNQNTLNVAISTSISSSIHISGKVVGIGFSCTLGVTSNNVSADLDIALGIKPADGELDIHLARINNYNLGLDFSGCGPVSSIANLATTIINSFVGQFLVQLLTPAIDNLLQGFLPNPLGIKGMINIGRLLAGVSPGTEALMEGRIVPGGYVALKGNGMSLGVITGINSDTDPATRTGTRPDGVPYASEPNRCVPPIMPPNFGAPPANLPITARSTYALLPANEFDGAPDPAADLAMGMSQTTLSQLGQNLVTSGAMCLGIGTSYIKQLNLGTIGILVPSLADLQSDQGNDPLLLVTRPQRAIEMSIGNNTTASPALTIGLQHMEVDFYGFIFERYVRAFTLDLTMNIGVNLAFQQTPGMPAKIVPTLVGISASSVTVKVLNSQFVKETPAKLEMVLPSVFDLITPLLGNLPAITVPSFAGFSLNNLSIQHVTTSQDDFLALYSTLGASAAMRVLAEQDPFAAQAVQALDAALPPVQAPSTGRARLVSVVTPPAETIRGALLKIKGGALPSVTFDVDHFDAQGRELEWTWRLNGGMWREFVIGSPLVISDRAFAWQGKYTIGLKSRVKNDYRTESDVIETPVVIDSVGPKIFVEKAKWDGDLYQVPVWDVVSGKTVQIGFGRPGDDKPETDWVSAEVAELHRVSMQDLLFDGELQVFAKDEIGNVTIALIAPFHGQPGTTGCGCTTGERPGAGGFVLVGLVALGLFGRRRRGQRQRTSLFRVLRSRAFITAGIWIGASVAMSLQPGCNCGNQPGKACETVADCGPDSCPKGQLPFCIDNTCVCSDDIPPGRIGLYSDVATAPDGTIWVSAYASSHGDLTVAKASGGRIPDVDWEWVDGVPPGPIAVMNSKIRGGIAENGPDVGMYTSIAVAPDGTPMVTYFDRDTASLKFAAKINGVWQIHIVDQGTSKIDPGSGGSLVGMYTSLTLRADDGRPGVAYLAHVKDSNGERAEVRYAAAQTTFPKSSGDWQTWVVDTGSIPPPNPAKPDIYPLPEGLGLFIDSARDPRNQAPVVVYYDRMTGDLKLSRFNAQTGKFGAAITLDGTNGVDAGWSPSVQVDMAGVAHVAYVGATRDDLKYVTDAMGSLPEVVDDGYRIVGTSVDGLPKPEFHFVGDDAGLVIPMGAGDMVVYQDATTQELLLGQRQVNGMWTHTSVAGATNPWPGAYGFFAAAATRPQDIVISTWVVDQPTGENWVEVFTRPTVIQ